MEKIIFGIMFGVLLIGRTYFKFISKSFFDSYKKYEPTWLVVYRSVIGTILIVATCFYLTDTNPTFTEVKIPEWLMYVGTIIAVLSIILIFWAHFKLGENFSPSLRKAVRIVKDGPYKYIRHPIYVGYIILFFSTFLITGWWLFTLLGELIMLSLVVWRLPIEEALLEKKFGDEYIEYKRRTKMFIPYLF